MIDIVTVYHNKINKQQAEDLQTRLAEIEPDCNFFPHSNEEDNLGFAKACNLKAALGSAEIIGFLNPDVEILNRFSDTVIDIMKNPKIVITGNRFNKPSRELKIWGVNDWVCGASFFVKRSFFEQVGGFDERFIWSWEETHMIRTAESMGFSVRSHELPIKHSSPEINSLEDSEYKNRYFNLGSKIYYNHWSK